MGRASLRKRIVLFATAVAFGRHVTSFSYMEGRCILDVRWKRSLRLEAAAKSGSSRKKAPKKGKAGSSNGAAKRGFGGSSSTRASKASWKGVPIDGAQVENFYDWLDENGVDRRRVTLADFNGLRGVMALENIPSGQPIVTVPYEATLDLGRLRSTDPTMPAMTFLQDHFLNPSSNALPYLSMIPSVDSGDCTTTDFFTECELAMLQCPTVVLETIARRNAVREAHKAAVARSAVPGLSDSMPAEFTEAALRWAVWVVVSRVLTVQGSTNAGGYGESAGQPPPMHKLLIPFIDMFNHHPGQKGAAQVLSGRATPGGTMKVIAGEDISAGEQIFIQYGGGMIGSDRFLQDYGFLDRFLPSGATSSSARIDEETVAFRLSNEDIQELITTTVEDDTTLLEQEVAKLLPCESLAVAFRLALKKTAGFEKRRFNISD